MIEIIRERILNNLFMFVANRCDYCLRKAAHYLWEDINYTKARFWNSLAKWFNKMEHKIYCVHYGEAQ